jgi:hypothetical protein
MNHRLAWAFLALCLVMLALSLDAGDWGWAVVMALFAIGASGTLYRYYFWPRRVRR